MPEVMFFPGLHSKDLEILYFLGFKGEYGISKTEIAINLGTDTKTIDAGLLRLLKKKLVYVESRIRGRKVKYIFLTLKGMEFFKRIDSLRLWYKAEIKP